MNKSSIFVARMFWQSNVRQVDSNSTYVNDVYEILIYYGFSCFELQRFNRDKLWIDEAEKIRAETASAISSVENAELFDNCSRTIDVLVREHSSKVHQNGALCVLWKTLLPLGLMIFQEAD